MRQLSGRLGEHLALQCRSIAITVSAGPERSDLSGLFDAHVATEFVAEDAYRPHKRDHYKRRLERTTTASATS